MPRGSAHLTSQPRRNSRLRLCGHQVTRPLEKGRKSSLRIKSDFCLFVHLPRPVPHHEFESECGGLHIAGWAFHAPHHPKWSCEVSSERGAQEHAFAALWVSKAKLEGMKGETMQTETLAECSIVLTFAIAYVDAQVMADVLE